MWKGCGYSQLQLSKSWHTGICCFQVTDHATIRPSAAKICYQTGTSLVYRIPCGCGYVHSSKSERPHAGQNQRAWQRHLATDLKHMCNLCPVFFFWLVGGPSKKHTSLFILSYRRHSLSSKYQNTKLSPHSLLKKP